MPVNDDDDNSTLGDTDVVKPEDDKKMKYQKNGDSNTTLYSFLCYWVDSDSLSIQVKRDFWKRKVKWNYFTE